MAHGASEGEGDLKAASAMCSNAWHTRFVLEPRILLSHGLILQGEQNQVKLTIADIVERCNGKRFTLACFTKLHLFSGLLTFVHECLWCDHCADQVQLTAPSCRCKCQQQCGANKSALCGRLPSAGHRALRAQIHTPASFSEKS